MLEIKGLIYIVLYYELLLSKALRYGSFNENPSFTCHPHVLSASGMSHACLYSPAAEHHCTLAGTHFSSRWGRSLSWPGWLDEILR